ncbi:hypothetical protein ACQBAT_15470 [Ornithinimicrobium sp. Y1847]|uniref:hypothetical protein n=1 Tax=Ornithinimicrobium sp. Y1847 TaxID=3405419 RepID=UPI003B683516
MAATPQERLRIALELAETGEQMVRQRLRREQPHLSEDELEKAVVTWRLHRPRAPHGDHPGPRSNRDLGR